MRIALAVVGMLAIAPGGAVRAAELVPGGYLDTSPEQHGLQLSDMLSLRYDDDLEFAFTPRDATATRLRLSLDATGRPAPSLELLERLPVLGLAAPDADPDRLGLTGIVQHGDFFVGGAVARAESLMGSMDLIGAGVGYGAVRTWLTYGQSDDAGDGDASEVLMLSTDLAAAPWLSVQGDLAVTDGPGSDPGTTGRIGLRLRF
jgi:hypothetical protein